MPKKSYKKISKECSEKQSYLWQAFQRNPDFQRFRDNFGTIKEPLIDYLRTPDCEQARSKEALIAYLKSPDGEDALARKKELRKLSKPAVKVIPYRQARIVNGNVDISPHLQGGRYLRLKLNLAESLTMLRPGIEFQLHRYNHHVAQRPQRVRYAASNVSRIQSRLKGKWLYIKLDLLQKVESLMALVEAALSEIKNRVRPSSPRRGISIDESDLELFDRVKSGESPYAIGREDSEDFQGSTQQKALRAVRKIKKLSE